MRIPPLFPASQHLLQWHVYRLVFRNRAFRLFKIETNGKKQFFIHLYVFILIYTQKKVLQNIFKMCDDIVYFLLFYFILSWTKKKVGWWSNLSTTYKLVTTYSFKSAALNLSLTLAINAFLKNIWAVSIMWGEKNRLENNRFGFLNHYNRKSQDSCMIQ